MTSQSFTGVLVANRGEIAVRVIRSVRAMGLRAAAVYSDADVGARHVHAADVAVRIGSAAAADSYLNGAAVIDAARAAGVNAIHPGYGFLAENAAFAQAVQDAGLVWIGPPPAAIAAMGDKIAAKRTVAAAGVPVVPGRDEAGLDDAQLAAAALEVGLPVLLKPSAGGGGKGMRLVRDADRLADDIAGARREARAAFGDDTILVERFVQNPRHIEVQVLADTHGRVLHLGERECSLQRRHQKIVEEAPSPLLTPARRESMGAAAVATARACGYVGVGTVEFIVSADDPDAFFFMEMNTRLQVEHPVTELVTGLDLVEWQLRVAAGEHLTFEQQDVALQGHAVEARLYAEDPSRDFLPTGGTVLAYREPIGDGIRVDSALAVADVVGTAYDPMLAKIAAWAPSRPAALQRLAAALDRLVLLGVPTNAAFLAALLRGPDVVAGRLDTGLVERDVAGIVAAATAVTSTDAALAAAVGELADRGGATGWKSVGGWRLTDPAPVRRVYTLPGGARVVVVTEGGADGARVRVLGGPEDSVLLGPTAVSARADGDDLLVTTDGVERRWARAVRGPDQWWAHGPQTFLLRDAPPYLLARKHAAGSTLEVVRSPMPGTVVEVTVQVGDEVAAGTSLIVVEAMKMEHTVHAPHAGVVTEVSADRGDQVTLDQPLVLVEPKER